LTQNVSGGIIAPAILWLFWQEPLLRTGQGTREGSIISPLMFLSIVYHISIIYCGSTQTTERYLKVSNIKVQRDYFKAMDRILGPSVSP